MEIYPAIDLIEGACVRLTEGKFDTKRKYSDDPVKIALIWKDQGASWLHIVDLDGAKTGIPKNLDVAVEIKHKTGLRIQYGGGIRNFKILTHVLSTGIDRAILGTKAIQDQDFLERCIKAYRDSVILSVDYGKDGAIFVKGWYEKTGSDILKFTVTLEKLGIKEMIITDISKDGTLAGIDLVFLRKILKKTKIRLIVAGGVTKLEDIINIKKLEINGIIGAIIGKALYEDKINLKDAIKIAKS